ncbi:MAG: acyl-CoA dehydratase activase-related protein, partial [Firmicutes bacterium]|nr:acyl-CoA dehydratase activase-related protein [Bacillota bacterium]
MKSILRTGLDVGSTTIKIAALAPDGRLLYSDYRRHLSDMARTAESVLRGLLERFPDGIFSLIVTGSGGISVSKWLGARFVQEVIAGAGALEYYLPEADVAIELGGEDAKITYVKDGPEQRMNGTCAGGTGAFIDQMASLLSTDAAGLDKLAAGARTIYPIASRCGVFAKSDIQPLLNDGASREDIAASIFQSVVNQTISGLACGKPIRGKVAFLGGPLYFLPELRKRFEATLNLAEDESLTPENGQLFAAMGAALQMTNSGKGNNEPNLSSVICHLSSDEHSTLTAAQLRTAIAALSAAREPEIGRLRPLFETEAEKAAFFARHARAVYPRADLAAHTGACYLGVDAGSTTMKAALLDGRGALLYSDYRNNEGSPLDTSVKVIGEIYRVLPAGAYIARAAVTGYGESLLRAALKFDAGEIETMAHFRAAQALLPGVDFVLDIGGQDMKCLKIKNGAIDSILLNEACSSGCGSFLETFARALNMSKEQFAAAGLESRSPVDLGSRCTVFMNSRVKQAQKEGASPEDISAGLAYSVIKNAINKVIKIRSPEEFGHKIIVQGGAFLNPSVLRAFELLSGREAVRPECAGLMGAIGAALLQMTDDKSQITDEVPGVGHQALGKGQAANDGNHEQSLSSVICHLSSDGHSALISPMELEKFSAPQSNSRCEKCPNKCLLTVTAFPDGGRHVTNNRCERGAGEDSGDTIRLLPNLYEYKYKRLFKHYKARAEADAPRGTVGIPRVLGMYETYPFWFTFFDTLGYRVRLSPRSTRAMFEKGIESMPSESVCYPAKLAHGHVQSLCEQGIKFIFFPCLPYERREDAGANNHYNCPIVCTYPEVIKNNMGVLQGTGVRFLAPFLPFSNLRRLAKRLREEMPELPAGEIKAALAAADKELRAFKQEIRQKGAETLKELQRSGGRGIVLAGRPYHADPEINHGIPEMVNRLGYAVFTEDSVASITPLKRPLRVVDQWTYHTRLYAAAATVGNHPCLELVQLNSFGCGLDAITTDQVQELMDASGRLYTLLKIDEVNNLGGARIRMRSLQAAAKARAMLNEGAGNETGHTAQGAGNGSGDHNLSSVICHLSSGSERVIFTKEMRKTHKLIAPQLSPLHFRIVAPAIRSMGYDFNVLDDTPESVEDGLRFVNNDACYPAVLTVGRLIHEVRTGACDPKRTALVISQTGGGCRATNYISLIRKALADAGYPDIPVVSVNAAGLEKNPGFKVNLKFSIRLVRGILYGDLLMRLLYRTRPYEQVKGSADALYEKWSAACAAQAERGRIPRRTMYRTAKKIVAEFAALPRTGAQKPRVGLVGEILVKFHPFANNGAVKLVEEEGGEAVMPDLIDFFLYTADSGYVRRRLLEGSLWGRLFGDASIMVIEYLRRPLKRALKGSEFGVPVPIRKLAAAAAHVVSRGNISGEGWFLTAEMLELI